MIRRIASMLTGLLLFAACGIPSDGDARGIAPDEVPEGLIAPESTTTRPEAESTEIVQLYYVRDEFLVPTLATVTLNAPPSEILDALISGPANQLAAAGFRSAFAGADVLRGVSLAAGVATVDLTLAFAQIPLSDQLLGLGEIVLTLTARPGVGQVLFTLDGQVISVPRADGLLVAEAVSREDYASLVAG